MKTEYDSTAETLTHIKRVADLMSMAAAELLERGRVHDQSKLHSPEKELFDRLTPKLSSISFGSDEYAECLRELKPALDHHYANNTHHPQYYEDGIDGMNLFDVLEMFLDWKAATERTEDGDLTKSIEFNSGRFKISDQLRKIMENTTEWLKGK